MGWVRSGRRGACDRGGVRNGSFPPLITGSGGASTRVTVPVQRLVVVGWSLPWTQFGDRGLIGQSKRGDDIGFLDGLCTDVR